MNRVHWVLILLGVLAVSTLLQMFTYSYFQEYDYAWLDYFITPSASLITGILLFFIFILPVFDWTSDDKKFKRFLILGLAGLVYSTIFILILHLFPILFYENPSDYKKSVFGFFVADFHNVIKIYLFQISILFAFEYLTKEKKIITQQKNLEIELNQTKLQLLKSQLHPHFLFNAMNSVVSEIDTQPRKAQEMLINLSEILRTTLDSNFMESITLKEELEIVEKYLSIEKMRYEEQLNYKIEISKKAEFLKSPKLILQPIVENAIKHGFKENQKPVNILIQADEVKKYILIKNNGAPLNEIIYGTGLQNVSERMKIFTGNENSFEIYQEDGWVINKLNLR